MLVVIGEAIFCYQDLVLPGKLSICCRLLLATIEIRVAVAPEVGQGHGEVQIKVDGNGSFLVYCLLIGLVKIFPINDFLPS